MTGSITRRSLLVAAAIASVARAGAAQSGVIRGAVTFEDGAVVPKGRLEVYLEDRAVGGRPAAAVAQVESDGAARTIAFKLAAGAPADGSRVVARLERAEDGWLIARGGAPVEAGRPVEVTLRRVMY